MNSICLIRTTVVVNVLLCLLTCVAGQNLPEGQTFTNPLLAAGADPRVIFKDGYYYTNTTGRELT